MTGAPVLLGCSHGTASSTGQLAVANLVGAVAAAHPATEVTQAFVDVEQPDVATVVATFADRPVRVVPLLLSAGYHVYVDLTDAVSVSGAGRPEEAAVTLMPALGPDPALTGVLADRLAEVLGGQGLQAGDVVLLGAAGSSDPRAVADCESVADELATLVGHPVRVAYGTAVPPRVSDAVRAAKASGASRVILVTYLLAPGWFNDLLGRSGADLVTEPLLVPDRAPDARLVDLVWRRFGPA